MTSTVPEYFEAFTNLQNELLNVFGDISKKSDPQGVGKDFIELQTKLVKTTIDNLTESVKAYRKALEWTILYIGLNITIIFYLYSIHDKLHQLHILNICTWSLIYHMCHMCLVYADSHFRQTIFLDL